MTNSDQTRQRADEFVLGLSDPAEDARIEVDAAADDALRAALAASRDRFVELDLTADPEPAPAALWDRIASRLDETEAVRAAPSAANDNPARRWRRISFVAIAASAVLAVGLVWSLSTRPEPEVIAVLLNDAGEPLAVVEALGDARARVVVLSDIAVPDGRTIEVWTKPSEAIGPVSLGLLDEVSTRVLRGPALPPPRESQLYEITLEREGGSPTGLPTGPILAKGFARAPR